MASLPEPWESLNAPDRTKYLRSYARLHHDEISALARAHLEARE